MEYSVVDNIGDATIKFDEKGICNYCSDALKAKESIYHPNDNEKD